MHSRGRTRTNWKLYLSLTTSNLYDKDHLQDSLQLFTVDLHTPGPGFKTEGEDPVGAEQTASRIAVPKQLLSPHMSEDMWKQQ